MGLDLPLKIRGEEVWLALIAPVYGGNPGELACMYVASCASVVETKMYNRLFYCSS